MEEEANRVDRDKLCIIAFKLYNYPLEEGEVLLCHGKDLLPTGLPCLDLSPVDVRTFHTVQNIIGQ